MSSRLHNSFVWVVFVGTLLVGCQETQSQQNGLPKDVLYGKENLRTHAGESGNSRSTLKFEAKEEAETIEQLLSQAKSLREDLKKEGDQIKMDTLGIKVASRQNARANEYKQECGLSPEEGAKLERGKKRIEQVNEEYKSALEQVSWENEMPRIQVSDFKASCSSAQQGTDDTMQHQDQEYASGDKALIEHIVYMQNSFKKRIVPEIKRLTGLLYALAKKLTDKGVPRDRIMAVTGLTEAEMTTL
jgi:hypothetical protein